MIKNLPLNIVGSSVFNRYPKISAESTYNMFISDDWLVPYPGFKKIYDNKSGMGVGRGIYNSSSYNALFVVIGNNVYRISRGTNVELLYSNITFSDAPVYIAENNNGEIIFCDGSFKGFKIFNYVKQLWHEVETVFVPVYVEFQDGYFIAAGKDSSTWYLSDLNDGTKWNPQKSMNMSTSPDSIMAAIKLPSRGGQLFIFGKDSTESWVDVGSRIFPYQKNTGYSIDYGCSSAETIAYSEEVVVWLATNKHSNPTIMYSTGGEAIPITTDGISYILSSMKCPEKSFAFLFKQDGHLFYQITFPDPSDNITLLYDFLTKKFFNITDSKHDFHPSRDIELFDGKYYFISYKDGNIYELSGDYTVYDNELIPRSRITGTFRLNDSSSFIVNNLTFYCEQGQNVDTSRIDLSISRDGGTSYGNDTYYNFSPHGIRENKLMFRNLGRCNEFTARIRMWGNNRFVIGGGLIGVYQ